ncbi:MAG: hypothetical protein R2710_01285 [Acidimicrobiales bacterium]
MARPTNGQTTTTVPDRSRQGRSTFGTERVDLGNGRTGIVVAGGSPLAAAPACRSNSCGAQSS